MAAITHFIVNTQRLLKLGTTGIAEEVKENEGGRRSKSTELKGVID
jgi:hypothetical protein